MGKKKHKHREAARGTGILEAQASAKAAGSKFNTSSATTSASVAANAASSSHSTAPPSVTTTPMTTTSSTSTSSTSTSSPSSNNSGRQERSDRPESSAAATIQSSEDSDSDDDQVRLRPNTVWGSGAATHLFSRNANPAAVYSRPRNGPPDEEVRRIQLDHGEGFSQNLHEQTVTITLTGPGWSGVRNEDIFIALLEKGLDPLDVVGYWKASEHRFMHITLRTPEAARYVQDIQTIHVNQATGTIRGQQHILDVKLHWVPA